jgi:signal transduction histidine kinase
MGDGASAERAERIFAEREARGLKVPVIVRLVLAMFAVPSGIASLTEGTDGGATAAAFISSVSIWVGLNLYFYWLLRRQRRVELVGLAGATLDVALLGAQLMIAAPYMEQAGISPGAMFKMEIVNFPIALIAINALAMRPRYPIVVGAGSFACLLLLLASVWQRPDFVLSDDLHSYLAGPAIGRPDVVNVLLAYPFITAAVAFVTHVARRTIRQTIAQEVEHAEREKQQLQLVMREKVEALAKLVAGVSHELNSPLGVIQSGIETQDKALSKVESKLPEANRKALDAARSIAGDIGQAAERIAATAESLRSFAHLDEAEFQKIDLSDQIELLVERTAIPDGKHIDVKRRFGDAPLVFANAGEIGQTLATLLENAFEAIQQDGTVNITVSADDAEVTVEIRDDGRGIAQDELEGLFDVALRSGDKRVAASFSLPAAQSVAHRHGGHISVESELGKGSIFTLHLPIE